MTAPSRPARRYRVGPPRPLDADRQRVVIVAALLAGLIEILGLLGGLPKVAIGRIVLSPSVVPSLVVAAFLGRRCFGRSRNLDSAIPFWSAAGLGFGFGAFLLARDHHRIEALGVLLASVNEEIIYRFAVPAVISAILISLKVRVGPARVAGFLLAAVWFVMLPGHRAQMVDSTQVLPFVAFAALAAFIVYRSGSFAATAATHTVLNMLTILSLGGDITRVTRSIGIACLLILLVAAYALPSSAVRPAPPAEPVIDLRDGAASPVDRLDPADLVEPELDRS